MWKGSFPGNRYPFGAKVVFKPSTTHDRLEHGIHLDSLECLQGISCIPDTSGKDGVIVWNWQHFVRLIYDVLPPSTIRMLVRLMSPKYAIGQQKDCCFP